MTFAITTQKYTLEEFFELDLPADDGPYELIGGEIMPKRNVLQPGPSKEHGEIISRIDYFLQAFTGVGATQSVGKVYSGAACVMPSGNYLIPDVSFFKLERVPTDPEANLPYPDIAIEIVSKSDIWFKVREKVSDYLKGGTSIVWVIFYPDKMIIEYQPQCEEPTVLFKRHELDGKATLPGFKLAVTKLFD